jgi:dTDP-glucose 4,6-dehydratase
MAKRVLVTGGAGFIGSNYVRYLLQTHPDWHVVVLDKLTYAGNLDNLRDVMDGGRVTFIRGDVADPKAVELAMDGCQWVINFAAETHVDRSIEEPGSFVLTDVYGTYVLLEAARKAGVEKFVQVSTDEVYGSVPEGSSKEDDPLRARSPYSASKAGGDLMAYAYFVTYGVPVMITRSSNNFGPYQHPEKLIPLFITNALEDKPLPVYGDGLYVRDWLYVVDHCRALDVVLDKGAPGEIYNIGAGNERTNLEITRMILDLLGKSEELIVHVQDRPGHDRRYSLDSSKIRSLGWEPAHSFEAALEATVRWYVANQWWWRKIKAGEFSQYYERMYGRRPRIGRR